MGTEGTHQGLPELDSVALAAWLASWATRCLTELVIDAILTSVHHRATITAGQCTQVDSEI
jgi:hypothetical protein